MFHLYQSNKVERLFTQLVTQLLSQELSPLEPVTIVVENPGLAHWLKMQLANTLGITANIEFPMPSRFFWQVQRLLMPDLAQESVYQKDSLCWLIFECLQDDDLMARDEFSLLQGYLTDHDKTAQGKVLRQYHLANTIADLYDQYLVYRPDWIANWEQEIYHVDDAPLAEQMWQGLLWFELRQRIAQKGLPLSHRANVLADFTEHLKQSKNIMGLPSSVIFFGFTTLPKHQLETLNILSKHMEVHLLTPNPCQHYWGDVLDETMQAKLRLSGNKMLSADAGNDLLASLGHMGKDYQRLLLEIEGLQEQGLFLDEPAHNLLSHVQNNIFHLRQAPSNIEIAENDNSIQVVGCHSPMREVEVLHDHLLSAFSQQKLKPQDVVVMIPDVASYAPFIDAVFNQKSNQKNNSVSVPYSISDRPLQASHPLLNAFILLLNVPNSRLGLSEVLSLLEMPAIYQAYGLQESQLGSLSDWIKQAGVRWGYDAQDRVKQDLPQWQQNTWVYGFKRLLMGYAKSSSMAFQDISPMDNIEGLDAALLGPLMKFVDDLHGFSQASLETRTAAQWSLFIHDWLASFFKVDDDEQVILEHVFEALENWVSCTLRANFNGTIEFCVLADGLMQRLQKSAGSQHFLVGKVNFCTLLPMRSIPFKLVAVLGLNDQDYPRSVIPSSLDLMHSRKRLGDRSRRNEDRYLFLEAILSARESLWLSYRSKSQQNNDDLTPSVVLAELLDYLALILNDHEAVSIDDLFKQHPLQAFNKQYFLQNSGFFSYNKNWLAVHDESVKNTGEKSTPSNGTLTDDALLEYALLEEVLLEDVLLEDLVMFYSHPAKYYLNKTLNINLYFDMQESDDDEPFELDYLDQYKIKVHIINDYLNFKSKDHSQQDFGEGLSAYGDIGQRQWQKLQTSLAPVLDVCTFYMEDKQLTPIEINVNFPQLNINLLGWQKDIYNNRLVRVVPSKLKAKPMVQTVIEHAALCAMGEGRESILICQDYKVSLQVLSVNSAKEYLATLLKHYQAGLHAPLDLLPQTAWQLYNPVHISDRKDKRESEAQKTFMGVTGQFGKAGEADDIHVRRCFDLLDEIPESTHNIAQQLYGLWLDEKLLEVEAI